MDDSCQERWLETRERIRQGLDAFLSHETGMQKPERHSHVESILDRIIKPEFVRALNGNWTVWRQDDTGNRFTIQSGLSFEAAKSMVHEFEIKGHKQLYWYAPTRE